MTTYNIGGLSAFWAARYDDRATGNGTYNITRNINMGGEGRYDVEDPENPGEYISIIAPDWYPIGTYFGETWQEVITFTGTINGNGHTLYNLEITEEAYASGWVSGLIGFGGDDNTSTSCYVNDLTLDTVDLYGSEYVGALIGFPLQAIVTNCHVKNVYFYGMPTYDGGSSAEDLYWCGGMVGLSGYSCQYTNCTADGIYLMSSTWGCAGFAGEIGGGSSLRSIVTNCSAINIYCTTFDNWPYINQAGGFVGYAYITTFNKCYCEAVFDLEDLNYGGDQLGGFGGEISGDSVVNNCYAYTTYDISGVGSVYTDEIFQVGGFVGYTAHSTYQNCYAYGSLTVEGSINSFNDCGGFAGVSYNASAPYGSSSFQNCFSVFPLTTSESKNNYFANFIARIYKRSGYLPKTVTITDCAYWTGNNYGDYAIAYINSQLFFPPFQTYHYYVIGTIIQYSYDPPGDTPASAYWRATASYTSTGSFANDYGMGKWDAESPTVTSVNLDVNLEDGDGLLIGDKTGHPDAIADSLGTDEDDADSLARGTHDVYRYYTYWGPEVMSHPYRWGIYPSNTYMEIETATWFERYWLTYIYPTFEYPGPHPYTPPDSEIPEPINFYSEPSEDPVNFYQRW